MTTKTSAHPVKTAVVYFLSFGLMVAAFLGCKTTPDNVTPAVEGRGTKPAIMVSAIVYNPDGRNAYVGAFPSVPTGPVDYKKMLELGSGYFYTSDGSIFFWDREAVTVTRYEVSDDYKLTKGKTISFINYGFKYGADLKFISPTKAIMLVSEQNKVIIWNPSTMTITSTYDANIPVRTGFESFPIQIGVSGNYMYYSIFYGNYDNLTCYPKFVVAAIPLDKDGPVTVFEDSRSLPGLIGQITQNGDIYVLGDGDAGNFAAYAAAGTNYPPSALLRIKAGQTAFDPSYFIDLEKNINTPAVAMAYRIDDQNILARVWDNTQALPAKVDGYFAAKNFISKKVNLQTGAVTDFPALAKGGYSSSIQDLIDNVTYFPLPNASGSGDVAYKLTGSGIETMYTIPGGGYWGMQRVR